MPRQVGLTQGAAGSMLVGILSFPVLVMRLSEAGLAARLRTPLASGHLGALVSLESVSLQSWPCVSCPGRLGSRGPCGERGSCCLALRWPWRASPASVGRGQAWLPSCSAPRVPLCRNPQKLPVCGHRASRSPSRSAHPPSSLSVATAPPDPPAAPLILGSALGLCARFLVHTCAHTCGTPHLDLTHTLTSAPLLGPWSPSRGACLSGQVSGRR